MSAQGFFRQTMNVVDKYRKAADNLEFVANCFKNAKKVWDADCNYDQSGNWISGEYAVSCVSFSVNGF